MTAPETASHGTEPLETEVVERDRSTLSQREIDQEAFNRLKKGEDPRSINFDLQARKAAGDATDGDEVDDVDTGEPEDGDGEAGDAKVSAPDTDAGGKKQTDDMPAGDPEGLIIAKRRLRRDYKPEQIDGFIEKLGEAAVIEMADSAHARNVEYDRLKNQVNNPQAKNPKSDDDTGEDAKKKDDPLEGLEARIAELREDSLDDDADMLERAVKELSRTQAKYARDIHESWLQAAIAGVEAQHDLLATDEGKVSLSEALDKLSGSGAYALDKQGIEELVVDAAALCIGKTTAKPAGTAHPKSDTDPTDGQPDFVDTRTATPKTTTPSRIDRDRRAIELLQTGMDPDSVRRKVQAEFAA